MPWFICFALLCFTCVLCSVIQLCLILCGPMDWSPAGSSVRGIFQARILEQAAISYSRGSSSPRDQTWDSCISRIGRQRFYHWCCLGNPLQFILGVCGGVCFFTVSRFAVTLHQAKLLAPFSKSIYLLHVLCFISVILLIFHAYVYPTKNHLNYKANANSHERGNQQPHKRGGGFNAQLTPIEK